MSGQDKFEPENRNEDPMDYNFMTNTSMGMIPIANPMSVCEGDLLESSCSSMVDSFCPIIWDHPTNAQNLGFSDINTQNNAGTSSALGFRKAGFGPPRIGTERPVNMGWTPPNSLLKGEMFVPTTSRMLPQALSQFPADSGFIERAARFSCFNGGNFSNMMNPFGVFESVSPYSRGVASMQGPNEMNMAEGCKGSSLSVERGATEGSPLDNEKKSESFMRSLDEAKESGEAEFSGGGGGGGGGGQEEQSLFEGTDRETSAKGHSSNKRKRSGQDDELDQVKGTPQPPAEATKDSIEIHHKGDPNPTSITNRASGKNGKQGSDSVKKDYIHIRARRGQATNSHSLAERVRREKISERMKFLQDLVPGCSKVTGKAVMLDEIINYVQSLQRQVEFLSMKLATVNPRLDFNIEGLLAKDILQSRGGSSSTHGFHQDITMPYPQLHPSQPGLIPSTGNYSDALRRTINSQLTAISGGYKEPTSQVPNVWEDELHNVIQLLGFNSSTAPLNSQDLSGSMPSGHMKAEP